MSTLAMAYARANHGGAMAESNMAAAAQPHLAELEAESIAILREAVAAFIRPVLLYSAGKDSSVLLHLARKAFYPARIPLTVLHIDTTWKFREMIAFRDETARRLDLDLIVHINRKALAEGVSPFDRADQTYTDRMKTQALRDALDAGLFDAAIGGARRDEEKSRAKERVFSVRGPGHRWEPRRQRPELWKLYNTQLAEGETMRIFPLSNWTELDVWQYIAREQIPVVQLYFAKPRPVVHRDGALIMVDDERFPLAPGEQPETLAVRFRTLGCYPFTGAVESTASSIDDIIEELQVSRFSERQGRLIDFNQLASMERKKQEGYF
jgi:sulfate adenylyltransferase subunit 2